MEAAAAAPVAVPAAAVVGEISLGLNFVIV